MDGKKILAIDPANLLGWAHSDGGFGTVHLAQKGDDHPGQRLLRLWGWLRQMHTDRPFEVLAHEDAGFGSKFASVQAQHNEIRGVLRLFAAMRHVSIVGYAPASIKSHATGHGHAKKDQMIRAAKMLLGVLPKDDNEADAIWILQMAMKGIPGMGSKKKKPKHRDKRKIAKQELFAEFERQSRRGTRRER